MNISDFIPQSLIFKVIGWIAIVGLVVGVLYATTKHYEQVGYDKRVSEDQAELNQALIESQNKTQALQHQLNEAQNALAKAKTDLLAINNINRSSVGKLRDSFNTYNGGLSNASREALSLRIGTLSNVVSDCSSRLIEVANDADTRTAEVIMLQKAWPK